MRSLIISCITLLFLYGCNQCLPLEKVADKKNTFELRRALLPIIGIAVLDLSDPNKEIVDPTNLVWSIRSTRMVDGLYFRITVPEIPKGFDQIVPVPPGQFELIKGKLYGIIVTYKSGRTCPASNQWIAE